MLLAFAGFSLWSAADASIHALDGYSPLLLSFLIAAVGLVCLCIFSKQLGGFRETFRRPKLGLRIFRGALLTVSNILAVIAFTKLELTTAYTLVFVSPLLAKVMSAFLLREKISRAAWTASAAGFAGVLIVLRPGWVPLDIGVASALGLTFFFALGYVMSRYIGEENQTPLSLAIFQYIILIVVLAVPAWQGWHETGLTSAALLLCIVTGVCSAAGSIIVAQAFARAPSAYVAPVHYTQILWGTFWGALLYSEYPDIWTALGAAVIIGAGLALVRAGRQSA
jgi:drug/metabolite transporter (DMT)-like permease